MDKHECSKCLKYKEEIEMLKRQGAKVIDELEQTKKELRESDRVIKELRGIA